MCADRAGSRPDGAGARGDAAPPAVVLVGVTGSGKSTVGRLLADALGVPLVETDALVARETGLSVGQLVVSQDPRLSDAQRRAALVALAPGGQGSGGVVTLGASLPSDPVVASALRVARSRGARVVELVVDTSEIVRREGLNAPRSVALGAPRAMLTHMTRQLRAVYAPLVDVSLDTVGVAPATLAGAVLASL